MDLRLCPIKFLSFIFSLSPFQLLHFLSLRTFFTFQKADRLKAFVCHWNAKVGGLSLGTNTLTKIPFRKDGWFQNQPMLQLVVKSEILVWA